ncbi:MAG: DUF1572 family protein, partial [Bacteroidetes bacterium]|nr:DUF1572 family protein [Bacteroidota bacterium]
MNQISEFKASATLRLKDNLRFITICLEKLSENEVWQAENETCNSVGNQILHVCGNMQQYAINAILKQKDSRDRDSEFSSKNTLNKAQLQLKMSKTTTDAITAINNLSETEWLKEHNVQSFKMTSLACVF